MYHGYYYGFDTTYLLLVVPALLIALIAQIQVKSAFSRYARVRCTSGLTGAQAAQRILQANGITDVRIEHISGKLTDHFDPQAKVIRLSDEVYGVASIAAVGVAAHEAGHAVQYATDYAPIRIRAAIIPATRIGSNLSWPLLIAGLIFNWSVLVWAGILLFGLVTVFQLVTLPVEFNASRRALAAIESRNLLTDDELRGARSVLRAAAMTYVAALLVSFAQLLRLILRQSPPGLTRPLQSAPNYRKIAGAGVTAPAIFLPGRGSHAPHFYRGGRRGHCRRAAKAPDDVGL